MNLENLFRQSKIKSLNEKHSFMDLPLLFGFAGKDQRSLPPFKTFLKQVHGTKFVEASTLNQGKFEDFLEEADGVFTFEKNKVIAVKTADCLPLLLTDDSASFVLALHAGWRGLSSSFIPKVIDDFTRKKGIEVQSLRAFIGPCISFKSFQVGEEVVEAFRKDSTDLFSKDSFMLCYKPDEKDRFLFSLKRYAFFSLVAKGLLPTHISILKSCTKLDENLWHSFRREKEKMGSNWTWIKKI